MRHYRVTLGDALQAHEEALTYGGAPGIRSLDLIASAIGQPYHGYHRSIYRKAAALLQSLAQNHGFVDGNKRTALLSVDLLIRRSNYKYRGRSNDVARTLENLVLGVVEHRIDFDESVATFEALLRR